MHADWFKTQLAQSVEAMKVQIYIWMIKVNKLIFFFVWWYFLKELYNIASGKRAFWLVNTLDPFARGLHAHVSLFICTFSRRNKT